MPKQQFSTATTAKAGDVVTASVAGAHATKRRPAVVVSSDLYHQLRPDVVIGVLTTNVAAAHAPTDYFLQDWQLAGLHRASAFRSFFVTLPARDVTVIGRLSAADWSGVQACLKLALDVP